MGKLTAILLILLILAGLYIYHTNPHIIDDAVHIKDNLSGNGSPGGGTSSTGTSTTETPNQPTLEPGWNDVDGDGSSDVYVGNGLSAVKANGSYVITRDRNGDGVVDAIYIDTTGDGNLDTAYLDNDYDGKTDTWITELNGVKSYSWDMDGNGIPDVYDTNGDGKADAWDLNGDGTIDERDVDYDGNPDLHDYDFDGVFDEFEGSVTIYPPENGSEAEFKCPDNREDAYRLYVQAYNNVTKLMAENQSSKEAVEAYEFYLKARECYESFSTSTTSSSGPITGTLGEVHRVTLDTDGASAVRFSTGEVVESFGGKDVDLSAEPWCVEYPALLGHYVDLGEMSLEEVTVEDIPSSGYPGDEMSGEIKAGHVYASRNADGTYTVFALVSHEKTSECSHRITIAYRNVED